MNYLLHIIIRVRFVRTCAQNNNYNNNKENKKKVLACVLTTRSTLFKKKILYNYLEVSELLFPVHVGIIFSTPTKKFSYV